MSAKDKIFKLLREKKTVTGKELSELFGISRQAVNKHLKALVQDGKVVKEGATKGAVYRLAAVGTRAGLPRRFRKKYPISGLEEHQVFREMAAFLNLESKLTEGAFGIVQYAFTEILNNAIEHSGSRMCDVEVDLDQYEFHFVIKDYGIGIYYSIFSKFNLPDENAAILELIKGKTTTMKERHSGEGVFFTSKSADAVSFRSHKIELIFDNQREDVFIEEKRFMKGTEVSFGINRRSRRSLDKIFSLFAPEEFDYKFEKTKVMVNLLQKKYVSRSEAKRLMAGLDKFREIVLDFKGVNSLGQGFADEIFRVFRDVHPDIIIKITNLNPCLKPIIKHVVDDNIWYELTIS